jgi:hypothetical protein
MPRVGVSGRVRAGKGERYDRDHPVAAASRLNHNKEKEAPPRMSFDTLFFLAAEVRGVMMMRRRRRRRRMLVIMMGGGR